MTNTISSFRIVDRDNILREDIYMSEKSREIVVEEFEQKLDENIDVNRINEIELRQQTYQKEVDEKFDKIFKSLGI